MKRVFRLAAPALATLGLAACAAGSGDASHAAAGGPLTQFLLGLWHGIIGPVTLLVEIINAVLPHVLLWKAHLYETKAAGAAYDIGFCLGFGGGPLAVWSRWRRR